MENQAQMAAENPFGFGNLLNTIFMYLEKPREITVLNLKNKKIIELLTKKFLPEAILVTVKNEDQLNDLSKFPFFEGKQFPNDKTTVFVCKDFSCSLPLESIPDIEAQL